MMLTIDDYTKKMRSLLIKICTLDILRVSCFPGTTTLAGQYICLYLKVSSGVKNRAVESEFKSNLIFPIFSDFPILSDFLSDFIRFLDFSRLLDLSIPQL